MDLSTTRNELDTFIPEPSAELFPVWINGKENANLPDFVFTKELEDMMLVLCEKTAQLPVGELVLWNNPVFRVNPLGP